MKKLDIVTPTECRAAGLDLAPLDLIIPEPFATSGGRADYTVWPIALADLELGDVSRLCEHLRIRPERLVLVDPYGVAEIDLPADALGCFVARTTFRSYEKTSRLIALPPLIEDPGPAPGESFKYDVSYYVAFTNSRETPVFNCLKTWYPSQKGSERGESAILAALRACVADNAVRQADGTWLTRGPSFSPRMYLEGSEHHDKATRLDQQRVFAADVKDFTGKADRPEPEHEPFFGPNDVAAPIQNKESRSIIKLALGERAELGTGSVPLDELRHSAMLSRTMAAVTLLDGGSMPVRVFEAAALARPVFLIGDAVAPFGADCSPWLTVIPREDANKTAELIWAQVRNTSDAELCSRGRAAREFFDRVARPSAWPARLAEILP